MNNWKQKCALGFALTLFNLVLPATSHAQPADLAYEIVPDRPMPKGTPLITHKRYTTSKKFEFGFFPYDVSVLNDYVEHPYALHLGFGYHFADWFAVEGMGGYVVAKQEADIVQDARTITSSRGNEPGLTGLWQTDWFAGANLQWAPIYGKLSLVSEADLGYQLYGLLGGGVDGIRLALNNGSYTNAIRGFGNLGAGVRLFLMEQLALRIEFENRWGLNPGVVGPDQRCPGGYVAGSTADGSPVCGLDINSSSWIHIGLSLFV